MSSEKTTPAVTRMVVPRLIRNIRVSETSPIRTRRLTQTISFGIRASIQPSVQASRTATNDMTKGVNQKFTHMQYPVIRVRVVDLKAMLMRHPCPAAYLPGLAFRPIARVPGEQGDADREDPCREDQVDHRE